MKITGHRTEHVFRQYAIGEDEDVRKTLATVASDEQEAEPSVVVR